MIEEDGAQETEVAKEGILLIIWLLYLILLGYTYRCQGYFRPLYFFHSLHENSFARLEFVHTVAFKDS